MPATPKPTAPGSKRKPSKKTDAGLKTETAFDDDGEARGVRGGAFILCITYVAFYTHVIIIRQTPVSARRVFNFFFGIFLRLTHVTVRYFLISGGRGALHHCINHFAWLPRICTRYYYLQ